MLIKKKEKALFAKEGVCKSFPRLLHDYYKFKRVREREDCRLFFVCRWKEGKSSERNGYADTVEELLYLLQTKLEYLKSQQELIKIPLEYCRLTRIDIVLIYTSGIAHGSAVKLGEYMLI